MLNASVVCSGGDHLNTKYHCIVTCDAGFWARSESLFVTSYETTCESSGKWSNDVLRCISLTCELPQTPANGNRTCTGVGFLDVSYSNK